MLLDRLFFKGMSIASLSWKDIPIVIINTHLLANFAGDWERHGMYARVEEKQLWQLSEMVNAQTADSVVIVVRDFNIPRGSGLYRDFIVHSGLTDLLADDTRPTLRIPFNGASRFSLSIDYILVRIPHKYPLQVNCDLCFSEKYAISSKQEGYLSDHFGIEVQITIH